MDAESEQVQDARYPRDDTAEQRHHAGLAKPGERLREVRKPRGDDGREGYRPDEDEQNLAAERRADPRHGQSPLEPPLPAPDAARPGVADELVSLRALKVASVALDVAQRSGDVHEAQRALLGFRKALANVEQLATEGTDARAGRSPAEPPQHELPRSAGAVVGVWCDSRGCRIPSATRCAQCGTLGPGERCGIRIANEFDTGLDAFRVLAGTDPRAEHGGPVVSPVDGVRERDVRGDAAGVDGAVGPLEPLEEEVLRCLGGTTHALTPPEVVLVKNLYASKLTTNEIARNIRFNRSAAEYFARNPTLPFDGLEQIVTATYDAQHMAAAHEQRAVDRSVAIVRALQAADRLGEAGTVAQNAIIEMRRAIEVLRDTVRVSDDR